MPEFLLQKERESFWSSLFSLAILSVDREDSDSKVTGLCCRRKFKCLEQGWGAVILERSLSVLSRSSRILPMVNQLLFRMKSLMAREGNKLASHYFLYQPPKHHVLSGRQSFLWDLRNCSCLAQTRFRAG